MAKTTRKVSTKAADKRYNSTGVVKSAVVSEDDIRFRAYELFQKRACNDMCGDAMTDWLQAERELANQVLTASTKRRTRV